MKVLNWESVEESTPFPKLPAGGYVINIVDVEDVPYKEYVNIVYDIAEGDYAGFYGDEFGRGNPWAHRFVRSYKESASGMFKQFLARLEDSNPGFDIASWQRTCNERAFIGMQIGIVLQNELYTSNQGEDRERLTVVSVCSVQDIRTGNYRLPDPKDRRTAADGAVPATPSVRPYDDVPF